MDKETGKPETTGPETSSRPTGMGSRPTTAESTISRLRLKSRGALMSQKLDQQFDKRSLQTALSIIRVAPIGSGTFFNNKVGSSINSANPAGQLDQQTLVGRNCLHSSPSESGNGNTPNGCNNATNQGGFNLTGNTFVLPTSARKVRDSGSLLFLLAFIGFLVYIIWDGMQTKSTDINLVVHGHDSFGNICGRNNRPIQFVDKSGQNYTSKPYTKYTLINSQFERYTLLPSNNGELLYVKERILEETGDYKLQQQLGRQIYDSARVSLRGRAAAVSSSSISRTPPVGSTLEQPLVSRGRRAAPSAQGQGGDPLTVASAPLRAPSRPQLGDSGLQTGPNGLASGGASHLAPSSSRSTAPIDFELVQRNRTLLNNLKASLMYQYPPMHDYNSPLGSRPVQAGASSSGGGHVDHAGSWSPSSSQVHQLGATTHGRSSDFNLAEPLPADGGSSLAARSSAPRVVAAAARRSPAVVASTMATTSADLTTVASQRPLALATNYSTMITTTMGNRTAQRTNIQRQPAPDDLIAASESDSYDHMLVTPVNTNSNINNNAPRRRPPLVSIPSVADQLPPDGLLNHNEFTGTSNSHHHQLLYLTECVETCPMDHIELIFYRCIPNNWRFSLFPNAINVTRTFIDDILTDVTHCYRELIYTFSLALVLSLALLILLRFLASLIIWSCIILLVSLFLALASYSWLTYYYQILDVNNLMPHDSIYAEKLALSDKWLIGSIFLTFLAFATIGMVLFMRKRILLVTMLFKESGKAIADMPLLLLQPLFTFAALGAITVTWSLGLICLQSMKSPVVDFSTGFVVFRAETLHKIMKWYHIFAFLWVSHFAIACQHYVIGASVSKWYFSPNRYNLNSPIGASISELILYYLGSVALGSFLVAIFKVVRIITRQIQFLVQRNCMSPANSNQDPMNSNSMSPASGSSCCGSLTYMWRLFIWFFDNIVMIINRDAYVEIAIHGDSFLTGARRAFTVLANNPLRLLAIKSVSNILLMIAKVCVVFGTISVAMMLLEEKSSQLNYSWSPVVISAIYAYIVAHWFLSVYEMVIDALFICYCEDYEQAKSRELSTQLAESHFMRQILTNGHIF